MDKFLACTERNQTLMIDAMDRLGMDCIDQVADCRLQNWLRPCSRKPTRRSWWDAHPPVGDHYGLGRFVPPALWRLAAIYRLLAHA
ncbi:hypothetical protein ACWC2T_28925 [Streptomyces sp. NPDC001393]